MISITDYVLIVIIGVSVVYLCTLVTPIRKWKSAAFENKIFFWGVLSIWLLLTWPSIGDSDAYLAGQELGGLRIARVIVFITLGFVLLLYIIFQKKILRIRSKALLAYFAYATVCMISSFYSVDPLQTLWKSYELFVVLLLFYSIYSSSVPHYTALPRLVYGILFFVLAAVVMGIVAGFLYPEVAFRFYEPGLKQSMMGGVFPRINPNTFGQFGAILAVTGLTILFSDRKNQAFGGMMLLVLGAVALILAHSRTSLVSVTIVALAIIVILRRKVIFMFLIAGGVGLIHYLSEYFLDYMYRGQDIELFMSMTGRTKIWAAAYEGFLDKPLLGWGYYSGHKSLPSVYEIIGGKLSSLDNIYIESLVNVGIVGTVFIVAFIYQLLKDIKQAVRKCWRSPRNSYRFNLQLTLVIIASVVVLDVFRSLTGPAFQVLSLNLTIIMTCVIAMVGINKSLQQERKIVVKPVSWTKENDERRSRNTPQQQKRLDV